MASTDEPVPAGKVPGRFASSPSGTVSLRPQWTHRHSAVVRLTHWTNVLALTILLMSGLQIFNAHPGLYWGEYSDFRNPSFAITAERDDAGRIRGVTKLFGRQLDTTGVLGVSRDTFGNTRPRAFPSWVTLPPWQSLAEGRHWHFFFAWVFVASTLLYLVHSVIRGHIWRDLLPTGRELRHIARSAWDHLRFRFPEGQEARSYNVLQKLTYLVVIFVLFPLMVLSGLTMSPRLAAGFPQLLDLFGGRQSARTIHFIIAFTLLAFVLVHVFMVVVSGAWNNIRSMLTGRYVIRVRGGTDG